MIRRNISGLDKDGLWQRGLEYKATHKGWNCSRQIVQAWSEWLRKQDDLANTIKDWSDRINAKLEQTQETEGAKFICSPFPHTIIDPEESER
jgi:hypothetical protein